MKTMVINVAHTHTFITEMADSWMVTFQLHSDKILRIWRMAGVPGLVCLLLAVRICTECLDSFIT